MTKEDREIWEDMDDDERLDAYKDALDNLREMEGRYKTVRAQLNAMISDHSAERPASRCPGERIE